MSDTGIPVGGFIGIVLTMIVLNVAAVLLYNKFMSSKALPVKIDAALAPKLRYAIVGLLFLSWIFSVSCTATSTFVKITVTSSSSFAGFGASSTSEAWFGLPDHGGDSRVETAYAFGVINTLLTTIAMIACLLVVLPVNAIKDVNMANKIWSIMGWVMLVSTWCCLFTFYIQESVSCTSKGQAFGGISLSLSCSLGGAGVAQVFNTMFLIGICVLFFVTPLPFAEGEDGNDGEQNPEDEENQKKEEDLEASHTEVEESKRKEEDGNGDPDITFEEENNKKEQDGNIAEVEDASEEVGNVEEIDLGDDTKQPAS